jgi:hypothetical protein
LLWDGQASPLFIPYGDFEEVFAGVEPASDGQYKVQLFLKQAPTELYIARAGRFGVDGYFGLDQLEGRLGARADRIVPELSHSQVQTILAAIGTNKNCDVWLPTSDRCKVDSSLAHHINWCMELPPRFGAVSTIVSEVDVIWTEPGSGRPRAMFEIEHSTPIYSGLLRFNDIHLSARDLTTTFAIVSNESRRSLFSRQVRRPTFVTSGLSDLCSFMRYDDVYAWYRRTDADAHPGCLAGA